MPPQKKAAAKLGPQSSPSNQPPWAMVSLDGAQTYYPQSADEARSFAAEHGAVPANPDLWPWANEVPIAGTDQNADNADLPADGDPKEPSASPQPDAAPAGPTGGPTSALDIPGEADLSAVLAERIEQPAQAPAAASAGVDVSDVTGCPTPALCWPLGLPHGCSYVTCVHGAWPIGD